VKIIIVGGSDAGISAGLRARGTDPSVAVSVLVADGFANFSICGLPFLISGETSEWRMLAHRSLDDLEAAGLDVRLGTTATAIDPAAKVLTTEGPDGQGRLAYDALVVATGAMPVRPPLAGLDLPGVHVLHTMQDAFSLQRDLERARRAVVIGGGYVGIELAEAFRRRELDVVQVEQLAEVMPTIDPELGALVAAELRRHGVDVRTGTQVRAVARSGDSLEVHTVGGDIEADVVLVAAGVRPDTALALTAGATLGAQGAIEVDDTMRTSVEGIFAAGDCVQTLHALTRRPVYLPLGTTAHKQGRVAGENAAGGSRRFAGSIGTQTVKVFDLAVARTGLRDTDAAAEGFRPLSVDVVVDDRKAYYPGATKMHIRLTGDRDTQRLLGAQIVGHTSSQASKRIDTIAATIQRSGTVDDLCDLDLSYTPPFSSPWDPVQIAAQAWMAAATKVPGAAGPPASVTPTSG
jgi:NADPH-dependent 2,4-dienoyl-CoA reductase/sulfur reductase-like enzyme